jgi:hypothetical protein
VYLDDVVLASITEEDHLVDIENFLRVLIRFGVKLRIDKCHFGRKEIRYLGYMISEAGIRVDPKNVAAVEKFTKPKTITQLRSFLGSVGYFRRFIMNFSGILGPLYELTKNEGAEIKNWKEEHDQAFKQIIKALTTAPVLATPKFGEMFVVETDASKTAVGGCLLQRQTDDLEHPIIFVSRKLNKFEARYPSVELEALGVIYCLKEFRPYIEGAKQSLVRTDNSALCSLFRRKDLVGRLAKYQLVIQEFNVKIEYRKGKENVFADYLSRYPAEINQVEIEKTISEVEVKKEQKNTKFTPDIYEEIAKNKWPENEQNRLELKKEIDKFTIFNEMVFKNEPFRLFIPYNLRKRVIKIFHCCPLTGGHLGIQKTMAKILGRFWWPGINKDVKGTIKACNECQFRKSNPAQNSFELTKSIEPPTKPLTRVHADILGPLPTTQKNNKYILGIVDSFSKWLIAVPMVDQTAISVVEAFVESLLTKFGMIQYVITDNGRQFTSLIFDELSKIYNFKHIKSTAYRPETNGQIERENATIANMLSTYVEKTPTEWDRYLSLVTFAYNSAIQASSAFSPFFIMFGQDPKFPSDIALGLPDTGIGNTELSIYAQEKVRNLRYVWDHVRENLVKSQLKQREFKDQYENAAPTKICELDLVLLIRPSVIQK